MPKKGVLIVASPPNGFVETGEDVFTRRAVTTVMAVIALLAFVFSFGNVWALALRLGVPSPVAPLIAPMVDLSVTGLLVGLRYLSLRGVTAEELAPATRLMHLCGVFTLALNVAEPIAAGHYGRAAVDSVAPLLLLGWGQVGPLMLRHFHELRPTAAPFPVPLPAPMPELATAAAPTGEPTTVPVPLAESNPEPRATDTNDADGLDLDDEPPAIAPPPAPVQAAPVRKSAAPTRVDVPTPAPALVNAARLIADEYKNRHGEPMPVEALRARLNLPLPLVTSVHELINA